MFCVAILLIVGIFWSSANAHDEPLGATELVDPSDRTSDEDDDYEDAKDGGDFWKEVIWNPNKDGAKTEEETGYKVVCFFPNWAGYRKPPATFLPKDVDPNLCTHIHYLHISVHPSTLILVPSDYFADFDKTFFEDIVFHKTKSPKLKVLVTLGGSGVTSDEYHRLMSSAKDREHFIENVRDFLTEYDFDGLDLMLPHTINKKDLAMFLKEVRENFDQKSPRLLMSASVSGKREIVEEFYDVDVLAKCLDYIHVMTYDYHSPQENSTGHQASMDDVIGEMIRREKWQKVASHQGCYVHQGLQWASYDDPQTVLKKGQLVTRNKYGGMALRDLSTDDFLGRLCQCKYPILQAINYALERDTTCFFDNCP